MAMATAMAGAAVVAVAMAVAVVVFCFPVYWFVCLDVRSMVLHHLTRGILHCALQLYNRPSWFQFMVFRSALGVMLYTLSLYVCHRRRRTRFD